jgi:hypothetical protein
LFEWFVIMDVGKRGKGEIPFSLRKRSFRIFSNGVKH